MSEPYRLKVTWANGDEETIESVEHPEYWMSEAGFPIAFTFPDGSTINMAQVRRWTLLRPNGTPKTYFDV